MTKGWREPQKNREGKSIRHFEVSHKKDLSTTLRHPLVAIEGVELKTVKKGIKARNPIDEMKQIRDVRYQSRYAIIREVMQNSARAGSKNKVPVPVDIVMTITPTMFKIEDNAGGVTKYTIDKVFNLGESGWNLGKDVNAFGEGFMSFIILFNRVEVTSNDIYADFDWESIEKAYDKDKTFDLMNAYDAQEAPDDEVLKAKGKFIAKFTKPVPEYNYNTAIQQAIQHAKSTPVRSVMINGELINNKIDFSNVPKDFVKVEKTYGDIIGIEGYFAQGKENDYIQMYDHGIGVGIDGDNSFTRLPALIGNININTTFYGQASQNRDNWVMDGRLEKTINFIRELAKERAIDIIKYSPDSTIKEYQHFISTYSTFDDIKYHIRFEVIAPEVMELVQKSERAANPTLDDKAFDEHMKNLMSSSSALNTAIERAKGFSEKIDTAAYNDREQAIIKERQKLAEQKLEEQKSKEQSQIIKEQEQVLSQEEDQISEEKTKTQEKTRTAKDRVDEFLSNRQSGGLTASKWTKETFWVERDMAMVYMNEISNATYHKIPLAFAENKYQKQLFRTRDNFHHIQELKTLMTNTAKLSSAGAKNSKERRIEYLMKVFIDAAGFREIKIVIANIEFKNIIQVPHSTTKIETPMEVAAYAEGKTIYFHRKLSYGGSDGGEISGYYGIESLYPYFIYNEFDLDQKSIGQGDIAVFSRIRKLLAHEMAHAVYHTTDNTDAHYKAMLEIDAKFDNVIAEFKASSDITTDQAGISKKAKERIGLESGDNVVVTYTKGSTGNLEKQSYETTKQVKRNKKDIFYYPSKNKYYTYEDILSIYGDNSETLQQVLKTEAIPIGYKIGDYVSVKETASNAYETKAIAINGKIYGMSSSGDKLYVQYKNGYDAITHDKIISKATPATTPKPTDIFYSEKTGQVKKYSALVELYGDDVPDMSDTSYKPTGFRIGDSVTLQNGDAGIIVDTAFEGIYVNALDGLSLGWYKHTQLSKLQSQPPTTSGTGTMSSIFNSAYALIQTRPMTYKELIESIPALSQYKKPQNSLWTIIKKYGIDAGLVEYTNDKPVKIKVKGT